MDFEDPLRGYRVLRHPSPDTDISSAPASPKEYGDRQDEVEVMLDGYVPTQENDDTTIVFRAFPQYNVRQLQSLTLAMSEEIQY